MRGLRLRRFIEFYTELTSKPCLLDYNVQLLCYSMNCSGIHFRTRLKGLS